MTVFWALSALIAAVALALVLHPFWPRRGAASAAVARDELNVSVYRDQLRELEADLAAGTLAQEDYESSRRQLEQRLLQDVTGSEPQAKAKSGRALTLSMAAAVPLLSLAVYLTVGNPGAVLPQADAERQVGAAEIDAMVERLADRLAANPDDVEGWKMLGKSYSVVGRFPEAVHAYSQAARRAPRDAQVLADLADALAMARGQSMLGEPEELVLRALQIDPANLKALALAGTAAFDRSDFRAAAGLWERMLPLVPAGSEDARTIQANVDEARTRAKAPPAKKDDAKKAASAPASAPLRGTISLSPKLAGKAGPEDTVFIFARAAEGSPMPLAVLRRKVRELPVKFSLDDSMAMTPAGKLSAATRVVVGARISRSGNAAPQPGDLQGASAPVASSAQGVSVVIDQVVQ